MDSVHGWMRIFITNWDWRNQTLAKSRSDLFSDVFTIWLWPDAFPRSDNAETKTLLCLGIATRTLIGRSRNTNGVPALESRKTVSSLYSRFVCLEMLCDGVEDIVRSLAPHEMPLPQFRSTCSRSWCLRRTKLAGWRNAEPRVRLGIQCNSFKSDVKRVLIKRYLHIG